MSRSKYGVRIWSNEVSTKVNVVGKATRQPSLTSTMFRNVLAAGRRRRGAEWEGGADLHAHQGGRGPDAATARAVGRHVWVLVRPEVVEPSHQWCKTYGEILHHASDGVEEVIRALACLYGTAPLGGQGGGRTRTRLAAQEPKAHARPRAPSMACGLRHMPVVDVLAC